MAIRDRTRSFVGRHRQLLIVGDDMSKMLADRVVQAAALYPGAPGS